MHIYQKTGNNILINLKKSGLLSFYYLEFSFRIEFDFEFKLNEITYKIQSGALGVVLLVNYSILSTVPNGLPLSISSYVNDFLYYKSRQLQTPKLQSKLGMQKSSTPGRIPSVLKVISSLNTTPVTQAYCNNYKRVFKTSENFYTRLNECVP